MKIRLIRIGNSRGIRLPKTLIVQAGLTEEVELPVKDGAIVIERASTPRAGWARKNFPVYTCTSFGNFARDVHTIAMV